MCGYRAVIALIDMSLSVCEAYTGESFKLSICYMMFLTDNMEGIWLSGVRS